MHQKPQKHKDATKEKHKTLQASSKGTEVPPHNNSVSIHKNKN